MVMTPLERKAAFRAAATLHEITLNNAARRLGVSYNHLILVLAGPEGQPGGRQGSAALQERIAQFIGRPVREVFPTFGTTRDRDTADATEQNTKPCP
jgi:transcriptional regulator with XRE-family HTH domain